MPTAVTSRNVSLPISHELSALASPREPDALQRQYRRANVVNLQGHSDKQAIDQLARAVEKLRRRILGGSGGSTFVLWQEPNKEIDPTLSVSKGVWVYISPSNDMVLTGLTDLATNANQKACEGMWEAAQDVPAKDGEGKYNVPTFPYPSATGTPTGSPGSVKGDLDSTDIFWIYHGQLNCA